MIKRTRIRKRGGRLNRKKRKRKKKKATGKYKRSEEEKVAVNMHEKNKRINREHIVFYHIR